MKQIVIMTSSIMLKKTAPGFGKKAGALLSVWWENRKRRIKNQKTVSGWGVSGLKNDNPAYAAAAPGSLPVAALWVILKSGQTRLLRKNEDCGGKAAAGKGKTV